MIGTLDIERIKAQYGPRGFVRVTADLLEGKKLSNGTEKKIKPEEFSLRSLWEGLVGRPELTLPSYRGNLLYVDLNEAVDSSAFVAISRLLLASKVIEGYNDVPTIGDRLVTVMQSKRRIENIAGFTDLEGLKDVLEGEQYQDSSIGEKYIVTEATKRGRLLSITEEAIMEDQTGQLLVRASNIGRRARQDREQTIIEGIVDKYNKVYRPSGSAVPLYSGSPGNKNLVGDATTPGGYTTPIALQDWTDIEEVRQYYSANMKTDPQVGQGVPITWNPRQLLVPSGLEMTALRIRNATEIRTLTSGQEIIWQNPFAGSFEILSTPYLAATGLPRAATDWYYGDFPKEFYWQEVWPIQVFRQDATGPEAFNKDIVAIFKVRYLGGIFAVDPNYVIKVKSA